MKRKLLSIITALALCLGMLPGTAWAVELRAAAYTKPLDFTNVGDGEGQTPASGDGYTFTGDAGGYTLTLDGISMNITELDKETEA